MDKTRQIIIKNKEKFEHFGYYLNILDKIEENIYIMPDVSIESCKSLFEGVSKTILKSLNESFDEKTDSANKLLKNAINTLSKYSNCFDDVFVQNVCGLVSRISDIRNERGDISHGKPAPKEINSDSNLSEMIVLVTDGTISYILNIYFNSVLPDFSDVNYEQNPIFNDFLDNEKELDGVVYSKALFDQDFISYKEQLRNYLSEKEDEDNSILKI